MTTAEAKDRFLIELDALASGAAPGFDDVDIYNLFDKVQDIFIKTSILTKNYDDLAPLLNVVLAKTTASNIVQDNSYYVYIPSASDYYLYVASRVKATRTNPTATNQWFECDKINPEIAWKFATTPFNKPYFKNPVVYFIVGDDTYTGYSRILRGVIFVDNYTSITPADNTFELTYCSKPTSIDGSNSFSVMESAHSMLVSMAVEEAVKSLKLAKVSTQ